jgi:hypothetical protein
MDDDIAGAKKQNGETTAVTKAARSAGAAPRRSDFDERNRFFLEHNPKEGIVSYTPFFLAPRGFNCRESNTCFRRRRFVPPDLVLRVFPPTPAALTIFLTTFPPL